MSEGGVPIYSFPRTVIEKYKEGLLSALVSSIIALNREALGKIGDRITIESSEGSFYILRGRKAFYVLMLREKMESDKVFLLLSNLAKNLDEVLPGGEIFIVDEELEQSLVRIIKELVSPAKLPDETLRRIAQDLFRSILEKTRVVPEKLKPYIKEALFPILVDKSLVEKERNPIKRLILSQCNGNRDIEEIARIVSLPLDRVMLEIKPYVNKGKIKYKVGYKLIFK